MYSANGLDWAHPREDKDLQNRCKEHPTFHILTYRMQDIISLNDMVSPLSAEGEEETLVVSPDWIWICACMSCTVVSPSHPL